MPEVTIQAAFDLAVQHHQAGRLPDAEQLYRKILDQQPDHFDAMHHLGVIAHQVGRNDIAVELIRQAIALRPNHADACCNLGNALKAQGKRDDAIAVYRQALTLRPDFPEAQYNLGNTLIDCGQLDEAIAAYRRAIILSPNYAQAHNNLGNALKAKGQIDEAIAAHHRAIALNPGYADAFYNLGNALAQKGQREEAITTYRQAIALNPNSAEAHNNLGNVLRDTGQFAEAITAYQQAIFFNPNYAQAHNNLGGVLTSKGEFIEAIVAFREAIALNPNLAEAHSNLGNALSDIGQLDEAIAEYRHAIALKPDNPEAYNNLGNALKGKAQLDEAIDAFRQSIDLQPSYTEAHSNLVFALHFHPDYDARAIAQELGRWNHQHADPLREFIQVHSNDRSPERLLKIGYVSPDFRDHVVGRNILSLIQHHDRAQFEISCYAQVPFPDAMTSRFQQSDVAWRNIVGICDEQAAKRIQDDQIDILVDLALHSANNRLLVFARKPAPVQVTYLGYCSSTGLSTTMDYRFSDPFFDPPETDLSCYTEKTLRLPRTFWCYQPNPSPDPLPSPALKNGFVTFGCLNNFAKVSPTAMNLWSRILAAVPNSRLIIHAHPGSHRLDFAQRMNQAGIADNRLTFIGKQSWAEYAQTYSQIDIALDPFPYGGGITTCDALWMGVPVITLSGQTAVGRGGRSILSNLNLPELIAFTPDEYESIVIALAQDRLRMDNLRQSMRARMLASPLMDEKQFARDVESAYRQMWEVWCGTTPITKEPRTK